MKLKDIVELTLHYLKRTYGEDFLSKVFAGGVFAFLFGNKLFAFLVLILIVIDFITGVVKSKKLGVKIESAKFRNTLLKLYVYYSLILTLNIVSQLTGIELILRVCYAFIALTEGKSIIENLVVIYPEVGSLKSELSKFIKFKDDENSGNSNR